MLCGSVAGRGEAGRSISLSLHGPSPNVHLKITDISRRLLTNIPDVLLDLLEIASYIYAADSAISRGGVTDARMGMSWRRRLRFLIPVRLPDLWSSALVTSCLMETLSFLSDDEYQIEFRSLNKPPEIGSYFEFPDSEASSFAPDQVMLFSGGLDSLAGAIEQLSVHGKKVALVSHRSASKIAEAQKDLVVQLRSRFGTARLLHIPVWAYPNSSLGQEHTHRTRSLLFAALGAVIARLFGRTQLSIFENGVVSLNLPMVAQVVGARATRTTHPQVLSGLRRLFSNALGCAFDIHNPFAWLTKVEVIERIARNGCSDLIRHTRSCTRVRDMTRLHPHCGRCSQCLDRRFGILAAGQEEEDPVEAYKTDLFLGSRQPGPDREMALAFIRSSSEINRMTDVVFFARYGETSRIVGFFTEPADAVGTRIFDLYRRHAAGVCRVFDGSITLHAAKLREGSLPSDCLLSLIVSRYETGNVYSVSGSAVEQLVTGSPEIRIAIDAEQKRVIFARWGEMKGAGADLIIALAGPFRGAAGREPGSECYPFVKTGDLLRHIRGISEETLRRRVLRCRNKVTQLAQSAGEPPPPIDAVIESNQWHGYRLNPDRIRIVAMSELSETR